MSATTGYYSLIQYCPDLARLETVNIGVLLFCPDIHFIRAKTARTNERIKKFFGAEGFDRVQMDTIKRFVENRLEVEEAEFGSLEDLERFVATRANEIQISQPRWMKVLDPEKDLDDLFNRLVGEEPSKRSNLSRLVKASLETALSEKNIVQYVRKDVAIRAPILDESISFPYAFQNGRLNLIRPVGFPQVSIGEIRKEACRHAVEGDTLYRHPHTEYGKLQMIVVAEFLRSEPRPMEIARNILKAYNVRLYVRDELEQLIDEIRSTAKAV